MQLYWFWVQVPFLLVRNRKYTGYMQVIVGIVKTHVLYPVERVSSTNTKLPQLSIIQLVVIN